MTQRKWIKHLRFPPPRIVTLAERRKSEKKISNSWKDEKFFAINNWNENEKFVIKSFRAESVMKSWWKVGRKKKFLNHSGMKENFFHFMMSFFFFFFLFYVKVVFVFLDETFTQKGKKYTNWWPMRKNSANQLKSYGKSDCFRNQTSRNI